MTWAVPTAASGGQGVGWVGCRAPAGPICQNGGTCGKAWCGSGVAVRGEENMLRGPFVLCAGRVLG